MQGIGISFAKTGTKPFVQEIDNMRKESGLTLFELMVVIGIMAVMASIAVPGVIGWLPGYRLRSGADELLSTLQLAKMRAVRENDIVTVSFDFANESYNAFVDNSGDGIQDAGERTVKTGQMPPNIDLQDTGLGALVMFDRRGYPSISGNVVRVTNGSATRTVNLTLAGSVSIQ
jgi:prepilin-type N-terminal cleavage/methylation domain-containing protein